MEFQKLTEASFSELSEFFHGQTTEMSAYTAAYQYMWNIPLFAPDYAVIGRCLLMKGKFGGREKFFYPVCLEGAEGDEERALCTAEDYAKDKGIPLSYVNVPENRVGALCLRYGHTGTRVRSDRTWEDYLYRKEDFCTFAGKKFAGQRNYVRRFYRRYPSARFCVLQAGDEEKILRFLTEYENTQFHKKDKMAQLELERVRSLVPKMRKFGMCCGYMEADGKILSLAAGERTGNVLVEDIEKALREYEGIYPATAQAFVQAFAQGETVYLNREDDSGDIGLRKSKIQYNPCKMVRKFSVDVQKPLRQIGRRPVLKTERLTIRPIPPSDGAAYARLAGDVQRNRYWGFDFCSVLPEGKAADGAFFLSLIERDFRLRNEMALGMYCDGTLVGEVVLHNFGYRKEAEVGVRVLAEYEGTGLAREALRAMTDYAFVAFAIERMEAKCYRENTRSRRMLEGAGMRFYTEDEKYFRFFRTPSM